ncbi:hypothetical protein [Aldersonia kunmingensis]|uniref:hypothetical protein n=1 Tax=Aldersonia kunmingensis TaxID=408066 RepID=UPI0008325688|nr:hypothetical protein [Aldersonia kunmingensis]
MTHTFESFVKPAVPVDDCDDESQVALLRGLSEGRAMACPFCGVEHVHVEEVTAVKEGYGGGHRAVTVNAHSGTVREKVVYNPVSYAKADGFWIELHIDCRLCRGGSLVLAQDGGATEWKLVRTPRPVTARVPVEEIEWFSEE